jgi:hypothetical protein
MSADAAPAPLSKVDSGVQGLSSSPAEDKGAKRRASSSVPGVFNINDLGMFLGLPSCHRVLRTHRTNSIKAETDLVQSIEKEGKELQIAKETQKLNWYVQSSRPKSLTLPRSALDFIVQHQQMTMILD